MPLLPDDVDDFVNLTLANFKKRAWTDISTEFPEYISTKILNKKMVQESGGPYIEFKVKNVTEERAFDTGLYAQDQTGVTDLSTTGRVEWSMQTCNWSYDVLEPLFQSDRETIIDMLKMRENSAMTSLVEFNERYMWTSPASSAETRPLGIPFWIQKDSTTTPDGDFNGGNPSGFSSGAAGIDSTAANNSGWKNWAGGYTNVNTDDLVRKVKRALRHTRFEAPVPHPELGFGSSMKEIYTVEDVVEALERLAETRNDNLGTDVARYMNRVTIGGVPLNIVWYLSYNDTTDPLYGVDWGVMRPFVRRGINMRKTVKNSPTQRNVRTVHYDTAMNYVCYDRRKLWVLSK